METQPASRRRKQLSVRCITVPERLECATRQFNEGRFFECHETLEEVWQQEKGELGALYKGIIQVAAGFVHAGRGNAKGANRLFTTALSYLAPFRPARAMGFDVERLCLDVERALRELPPLATANANSTLPLTPPVLSWDSSDLPAEALRWRAWGFGSHGEAVEMEITVIE